MVLVWNTSFFEQEFVVFHGLPMVSSSYRRKVKFATFFWQHLNYCCCCCCCSLGSFSGPWWLQSVGTNPDRFRMVSGPRHGFENGLDHFLAGSWLRKRSGNDPETVRNWSRVFCGHQGPQKDTSERQQQKLYEKTCEKHKKTYDFIWRCPFQNAKHITFEKNTIASIVLFFKSDVFCGLKWTSSFFQESLPM